MKRRKFCLSFRVPCAQSGVKEDWHGFAEELAQDRPVAVFDNRGVGDSVLAPGPWTLLDMAEDVFALMDHLRWQVCRSPVLTFSPRTDSVC
jgi:pimeloyl-ACP methyl ester carboxylesterase